jgi:hypothetical protein
MDRIRDVLNSRGIAENSVRISAELAGPGAGEFVNRIVINVYNTGDHIPQAQANAINQAIANKLAEVLIN